MSTLYAKSGKSFRVTSDADMDLHPQLPAGNYIIEKNNFTGELYLTRVDDFVLPQKIYGDTAKNTERILRTYNNRPQSTGVLLAGTKGAGKSLLAKMISVEAAKLGIPSIIINAPWCGDQFNQLIQKITQPCVVVFDEFEKVYGNNSKDESGPGQEAILTLLDGVFPTRKLFLLTCNDTDRIDSHMINRPGRLFYFLTFGGVSKEFILEYCQDNLKNKALAGQVVRISKLFLDFNFDMLQSIVEEANRYDEKPLDAVKMLNIKPTRAGTNFSAVVKRGNKVIANDEIYGDPYTETMRMSWFVHAKEPGGGGERFNLRFGPSDMIRVDEEKGIYVYEKDDFTIVLTSDEADRRANKMDFYRLLG